MAFSVVKKIRLNSVGLVRQSVLTVKGCASYTTGGDPNTTQGLSGGRIKEADFIQIQALSYSGTYSAQLDYDSDGGIKNFDIIVFVVATGAEVANGVDLSAEKWRIIIQGN